MYENPEKKYINNLKLVEEKWLNKLLEVVKLQFSRVWIPSHDRTHHYRVWVYAKSLVKELIRIRNFDPDKGFLESLLISCLFHDAGLSVTFNKEHGKESRRICENYLRKYEDSEELNLHGILTVIEQHDDKEYKNESAVSERLLHTLLSAGDDLDAFGAIGVIRYFEIYWLRNTEFHLIPQKVTENARTRFINFTENFKDCRDLISHHTTRYNYLIDFYTKTANELNDKHSPGIYSGILREYVNTCIKNKVHFFALQGTRKDNSGFYSMLAKEIEYTPGNII
jgi:HD superfamily phosphodiesterase